MTANRSPLRVCFVVPDLGIGGAERHVTTLVSRLDRSVIEPWVICIGRRGELFAGLEEAEVSGIALNRAKTEVFGALGDLLAEFRDKAPDVVIVRGFNAELLGRVAALMARVPRIIVWVHNCGDTEPRGVLRRMTDIALEPVTDAYFGVAQRQVEYLTQDLRHPERKIRVIHNGVDLAQFNATDSHDIRSSLGLRAQHLVVGIVAALRPEKDHETFLDAAALVAARVPDARFLIVGEGRRREALEAHAARLGIRDRVVFSLARDDVPAVLGAIDVFALTSYTVECFPMALLEAMAASRPAVCTAVGGVPEMIVHGVTGYLVPAKDPAALAQGLIDLLENPRTRFRFGGAARALVEAQFSLDRSVAAAQEAILDVAQGCSHTSAVPVRLAMVLDETSIGGVEVLALDLFRAFDPTAVHATLVCLRRAGPLADDFRAAGFEVVELWPLRPFRPDDTSAVGQDPAATKNPGGAGDAPPPGITPPRAGGGKVCGSAGHARRRARHGSHGCGSAVPPSLGCGNAAPDIRPRPAGCQPGRVPPP